MAENQPEAVELTADIVVIRQDGHILLIKRGSEPFAGAWALPGGYLDSGETPLDAAVRELAEETGILVKKMDMHELGVWKEPGRDPRGRFITTVFIVLVPTDTPAIAADDATSLVWLPTSTALAVPLAFDHNEILDAAVGASKNMTWGGR